MKIPEFLLDLIDFSLLEDRIMLDMIEDEFIINRGLQC